MRVPFPENIDTLRLRAYAELDEAEVLRNPCGCVGDDSCWPHAVTSLLEPTVEAFELPWVSAS